MKQTGTTTSRGYGHNHQTNRNKLLYNHRDGTPCDICGQPMYRNPTQNPDTAALEADHREGDKTKLAYRLLHRRCNRSISNNWVEHGPGWHQRKTTKLDNTLDWPAGRVLRWPTAV